MGNEMAIVKSIKLEVFFSAREKTNAYGNVKFAIRYHSIHIWGANNKH